MGALYVLPLQLTHISPDGPLGNFTTSFNEVSGTVTKHSERALLIDDFNYDGKNGLAVFLGGTTGFPSGDGEVDHTHEHTVIPLLFSRWLSVTPNWIQSTAVILY